MWSVYRTDLFCSTCLNSCSESNIRFSETNVPNVIVNVPNDEVREFTIITLGIDQLKKVYDLFLLFLYTFFCCIQYNVVCSPILYKIKNIYLKHAYFFNVTMKFQHCNFVSYYTKYRYCPCEFLNKKKIFQTFVKCYRDKTSRQKSYLLIQKIKWISFKGIHWHSPDL